MEERQALMSFAALSQETRLHIVRMLVVAGPDGMAAGAIAQYWHKNQFGHVAGRLYIAWCAAAVGLPVLAGFSRKGFLGALSGGKPPQERAGATAACAAAVVMNGGADFLRVHDVPELREAVVVARALRQATGGGRLFGRGVAGQASSP